MGDGEPAGVIERRARTGVLEGQRGARGRYLKTSVAEKAPRTRGGTRANEAGDTDMRHASAGCRGRPSKGDDRYMWPLPYWRGRHGRDVANDARKQQRHHKENARFHGYLTAVSFVKS